STDRIGLKGIILRRRERRVCDLPRWQWKVRSGNFGDHMIRRHLTVAGARATAAGCVVLSLAAQTAKLPDSGADNGVIGRLRILQQNQDALANRIDAADAGIKGSAPVGAVLPYAGDKDSVDPKWIPCDGRPLSSAQYPELFKAIGLRHGAGYDPRTKRKAPG